MHTRSTARLTSRRARKVRNKLNVLLAPGETLAYGPGFNCTNAGSWFALFGIGLPWLATASAAYRTLV